MENKFYCEKCRQGFEEGEIIGVIEDKAYHCVFDSAEKHHGCAEKMPQAGIYYQGKIYNIFDIAKLKNINDIKTRKTKFGFNLEGNLESLLNQKPIFG